MDFFVDDVVMSGYKETASKWMEKTLDFAELSYTSRGIDASIHSWSENKHQLIGVLSSSNDWNAETLSIVRDVNYVYKAPIGDAEDTFRSFIRRVGEVAKDLGLKDVDVYLKLLNMATSGNLRYATVPVHKERVDNVEEAIFFEQVFGGARPNVGMKWSRLVQSVIKKWSNDIMLDTEVNRRYSRWVDCITEQTIKYRMTISVNPSDFLLMSYGNSWSSCHIINPSIANGGGTYDGIHKGGTLDYIADSASFIVQLLRDGTPIEKLPMTERIQRCVYFIDIPTKSIAQSRLYPNYDDGGYRDFVNLEVQKALGEIFGDSGKWVNDGNYCVRRRGSLHYPDYQYYRMTFSSHVLDGENLLKYGDVFFFVGEEAHCIICGDEYFEPDRMGCKECSTGDHGGCECSHCGYSFDEEDGIYINDEFFCDDCVSNNFCRCEHCDEWVRDDDAYIAPDGTVRCEYCYSRDCVACERCGETMWEDESHCVGDTILCSSCCENHCFYCEKCGGDYFNTDGVEVNGEIYCRECAAEVAAEEEEEEGEEVTA